MTIQLGDTGRVAYGPLKTFTVAFATPRETLNATPAALPATDPGSAGAQASYTIASGDLPTITPSPISTQYTAHIIIGGKNTDAASQTITYKCYKNGTYTNATGTQSVATNVFWTQTHFRFNGVVVGDTIAISLSCPSANVNFDYMALIVYPTRIQLGKAYINKDVTYGALVSPTLSLGTPSVALSNAYVIYPTVGTSSNNLNLVANTTLGAMSWNSTSYAAMANYGDFNISTNAVTHATNRPYYYRGSPPGTITFREILR